MIPRANTKVSPCAILHEGWGGGGGDPSRMAIGSIHGIGGFGLELPKAVLREVVDGRTGLLETKALYFEMY